MIALISMFVLGALFMLCINSIIILYYSDQMEDFRVIEKK